MKISKNTMYNKRCDAKDTIDEFKLYHPKSKKKYKIRKEIYYWIEEIE